MRYRKFKESKAELYIKPGCYDMDGKLVYIRDKRFLVNYSYGNLELIDLDYDGKAIGRFSVVKHSDGTNTYVRKMRDDRDAIAYMHHNKFIIEFEYYK